MAPNFLTPHLSRSRRPWHDARARDMMPLWHPPLSSDTTASAQSCRASGKPWHTSTGLPAGLSRLSQPRKPAPHRTRCRTLPSWHRHASHSLKAHCQLPGAMLSHSSCLPHLYGLLSCVSEALSMFFPQRNIPFDMGSLFKNKNKTQSYPLPRESPGDSREGTCHVLTLLSEVCHSAGCNGAGSSDSCSESSNYSHFCTLE